MLGCRLSTSVRESSSKASIPCSVKAAALVLPVHTGLAYGCWSLELETVDSHQDHRRYGGHSRAEFRDGPR